MRQSVYYIPTTKQLPSDAQIASHQILLQGGYVKQTAAGIYSFLPLGLKVLKKIEQIVREELDAIGAHEIFMPVMQPVTLWEESGRYDAYGDELIRLTDRHKRGFVLGPTHEEVITDLIRDHVKSYKRLPVTLYQIQTKFRDEMRPRFGLMRGREFLMMDAYSFSANNDELDQSYQQMESAYTKILTRLCLNFRKVAALSGEIGGSESAEFMVLSEIGEDTIIYSDTSDFTANLEVFPDISEGMQLPDNQGIAKFAKGIEVGHIFKVGPKYSETMGANFTNNEGKLEPIIMGCYGIGVSRLVMAVIEQHQQNNKVVWPQALAPFEVHILLANIKDNMQVEAAEQLYSALQEQKITVLFDDRDERLGSKFGDAELIGAPFHVIIGKNVADGRLEIRNRLTDETIEIPLADAVMKICELLK